MHAFGDLRKIIQAEGPLAAGFGAAQDRQQQGGKNGEYCDNYHQFKHGESLCRVGVCFDASLDSAERPESRRRTPELSDAGGPERPNCRAM